jgi:hypothetical protein
VIARTTPPTLLAQRAATRDAVDESTSASAMADGAIAHLTGSRADGAFTGGDGTYSVPLGSGRTAWVFGDSFIGGVQPDGSRSNDHPRHFVRNSIVLQDAPDTFRPVVGSGAGGEVLDAAIPPGMQMNRDGLRPDQWYWPGHGTTSGDELQLFMNRFDHPPGNTDGASWNWRYHGTDLVRFDARTGQLLGTQRMLEGGDVLWGAAVLERDDHTYVYGAEDDPAGMTRHAHVARAPRGQLTDRSSWTFWDGDEWSSEATRSARIGARVSPQFGVVDAKDGSTLIVTQDGFDPTIRAWRSDSPQGPFDGPVDVARIPDQPNGRHVYNAVPHPQLTTEDGLLVSFNVGGMDFMADHTSYRPGFVRVPHDRLPGGVSAPRTD